jgi:hypothetical protein
MKLFLGIKTWNHDGVVTLLTKIVKNGYDILYLSARSIRWDFWVVFEGKIHPQRFVSYEINPLGIPSIER